MYVIGEIIAEAEAKYGVPKEITMAFPIDQQEAEMIRGSRGRHGRSHDVTVFAFQGEQLALIRKHSFPEGAYRAPSGGLHPGEPMAAGALREFREETGLDILLDRYLLRIIARFTWGSQVEDWVTHIFCGCVVGGQICPIDTDEIEHARFGTLGELQGPIRDILLPTGRGLFAYRVALTDATIEILEEIGRGSGVGD